MWVEAELGEITRIIAERMGVDPAADSLRAGFMAASVYGTSAQSFTLTVVQAPGAGVHARTRRSTPMAGSDQSMRASSTVIFGA